LLATAKPSPCPPPVTITLFPSSVPIAISNDSDHPRVMNAGRDINPPIINAQTSGMNCHEIITTAPTAHLISMHHLSVLSHAEPVVPAGLEHNTLPRCSREKSRRCGTANLQGNIGENTTPIR
jgi:hypothetical protein